MIVTMTSRQYDSLAKVAKAIDVDPEDLLVLGGISNAKQLRKRLTAADPKSKKAPDKFFNAATSYMAKLTQHGRFLNPGDDWKNRWGLQLEALCKNRGYTPEQVVELADWASRDSFWSNRIGPPSYLNQRLSSDKERWRVDFMWEQMVNERKPKAAAKRELE